jgi:hypothetical protein
MAATATATAEAPTLPDRTTPFKRKDRVVAAVDLPGIPAGTTGKVTMVAGFDWIRYWVRWDNGVTRGSMNRKHLVRPGEPYGAELAELVANAVEAEASPAGDGDGGGGEGGGDGGGVTVAGVLIPGHLLERSKKRREVLGA